MLAAAKPGMRSDWLEMTGQRIDLYYGLLDAVDRPQAYVACLTILSNGSLPIVVQPWPLAG